MSIEFQHSLPPRAESVPGGSKLTRRFASRIAAGSLARLRALEEVSADACIRVDELIALAARGLPRMRKKGLFAHTARAVKTNTGWSEQPEGESLRYTAMVALGLSKLDVAAQRQVLDGNTAADLARTAEARAETTDDPGAIALAAWAAAEAGHFHASRLFRKLAALLASQSSVATVNCAWALIAALAGRYFGDTRELAAFAASRLIGGQAASGLFPHVLPASVNGRLRAHIGCFADQVYPIQALSRLHAAHGHPAAMAAAEACAARICSLQGPAGQWWWHYDSRDGSVVEGYPVYSVHQHAMAPMALLDLWQAGGSGHWRAIVSGLDWLDRHPEVLAPLIAHDKNVIWRKVARREPNKAVRAMSAFTTALKPGMHLPWLDAVFPPSRVDYECRPYELGWLLYAWLSGEEAVNRAPGVEDSDA
ncbi:hypothetical protein GGE07_003833 [Sinorhizobium terangae]|uniref:hypothetical protein n=1 Tax=Sinorhizobium terangae TaxID=110322 RepID=UPI0017CAD1F8|nr:hypothetical protein [Sinorhizobium terangae]MBB4187169.1 hypothetical protein [Sinorhizobium terangae]